LLSWSSSTSSITSLKQFSPRFQPSNLFLQFTHALLFWQSILFHLRKLSSGILKGWPRFSTEHGFLPESPTQRLHHCSRTHQMVARLHFPSSGCL
jgi:hypothetical protein